MLYIFIEGDQQDFGIMVQHIILTKPTIFNVKMAMKEEKNV